MPINDYVTLADIKARMPNSADVQSGFWDTTITSLNTIASREIDLFTWRPAGSFAASDSAVKDYDGIPFTATDFITQKLINEIAAVPTLVEIRLSGNTWTALTSTDWYMAPYNAALEGKPYTEIDLDTENGSRQTWPTAPKSIRITGIWGYSETPPPDLKEAAIKGVIRLLRKAQQNYIDTAMMMDSLQLQSAAKLETDIWNTVIQYRTRGLVVPR